MNKKETTNGAISLARIQLVNKVCTQMSKNSVIGKLAKSTHN
jgi:hypothetical protein